MTYTATPTGQEATMRTTTDRTATITNREADCRAFAQIYPTPNVLRAVALAEAGTLTWAQVLRLFQEALEAGLADARQREAAAR